MDLTDTIQERKLRLEELRKRREQRQQKVLEGTQDMDVDVLVETIINGAPSVKQNNIGRGEDNENVYGIPRDPIEIDANRRVERFDRSVQSNYVVEEKNADNQEVHDMVTENTISNRVMVPPTTIALEHQLQTQTSITAIKKKITIIDNKQGLEKINHTMESKSVYSSIGIVERALNQMEEYDFFPEYINFNTENQTNRDIFNLYKQYKYDIFLKHPVTSLSISPSMKNMLLVSYADSDVKNSKNNNNGYIVLWDLNIVDHPYRVISLVDRIMGATFNSTNKNTLIGSLYSGFLASWSLSDSDSIIINNSEEKGHSVPIIGICQYQSSAIIGYITVSNDGGLCLWNQNSIFDPIVSTNINNLNYERKKLEFSIIPTALSPYDHVTNLFYVGNEDGNLLQLSLRDSILAIEAVFSYHTAPITSISTHTGDGFSSIIQGNEYFKNLVLTSSFDWSVCLWLPSATPNPILKLSCFTTYVICAKWHPTHPLLFFVVTENSCIQLWNLLKDQTAPDYIFSVPDGSGISVAEWCDNGKRIIVGTQDGLVNYYDIKQEVLEFREEYISDAYRVIEDLVQIPEIYTYLFTQTLCNTIITYQTLS